MFKLVLKYYLSKAVCKVYLGLDYAWTIAKLDVGMLIVNILSKLELCISALLPIDKFSEVISKRKEYKIIGVS